MNMAGVGAHGKGIDLPPPREKKEIEVEDVEEKVSFLSFVSSV